MTEKPCIVKTIGKKERGICMLFIVILSFVFAPVSSPAADNTIRVLLIDKASGHVPKKDEKVEKLGRKYGEVLLSGLKYTGTIEVWKGENSLYVVNEIPLEEYVKGVVAAEVGSGWDMEALKAQAVVARTYAIHQKLMNTNQKIAYHLTSSVLHQVYKGGAIPNAIINAVNDTKGEIITYEGEPIVSYYHSTSCDSTEDPAEVFGKQYPYLKPIDTDCSLSPFSIWEKKIELREIERALNVKAIRDIAIDSYTVSQRVKHLKISTDNGISMIAAKDMRKILGWDRLPSTDIVNISRNGGVYIFEGKGYGHGVGMCQWTALKMVRDGLTYREILSKFYPSTTIELYAD